MRRPSNLEKYTDKAGALAFLDELRASVEEDQDDTMFRFYVNMSRWREEWASKPKEQS